MNLKVVKVKVYVKVVKVKSEGCEVNRSKGQGPQGPDPDSEKGKSTKVQDLQSWDFNRLRRRKRTMISTLTKSRLQTGVVTSSIG